LRPPAEGGRIPATNRETIMTRETEAELRQRIAELEAEVAELRKDRKELRDALCAGAPPMQETSEEEYLEMMRNHVPGAGLKFLEQLGLYPLRKS
jgi:hypothetical protein